jgi:hypothetical protein
MQTECFGVQAKKQGLTEGELVLSSLLPIDSHLGIKALAGTGAMFVVVRFDAYTAMISSLEYRLTSFYSNSFIFQILAWTLFYSMAIQQVCCECHEL